MAERGPASEIDAARQALLTGWLGGEAGRATVAPLEAGHINASFVVDGLPGRLLADPAADAIGDHPVSGRGVLQRISAAVFPDPRVTAQNVEAVVDWLAGRQLVPALIPAGDGARHWLDEAGGCWRLWRWVAGGESLDELPTAAHGRAAGAAFGALQRALAGMPPPATPSLPGFLDLDAYLASWDATTAATALPAGLAGALRLVETGRRRFAAPAGEARLIHGDCKLNNLLFERGSSRVLCVLDLDTVMWAPWSLDYGDLIRSGAVLPESAVPALDLLRYEALSQGFLEQAGVRAQPDDLVEAPARLCFMLALRFLTDHLQGDRYFRVSARGDNRRRSLAQFALLQAMDRQRDAMRRIAERLLSPPATAPA